MAEWVAAVFTGGALFAAVHQLRRARLDAEQARKDDHEAMARAVGVEVNWLPNEGGRPDGDGLMRVRTEILNAGRYPISDAVLKFDTDDYPFEVVIGTILPGRSLQDTNRVPRREVVFAELTSGATLLFTDAYGNHWARSPHELERRDHPARIC